MSLEEHEESYACSDEQGEELCFSDDFHFLFEVVWVEVVGVYELMSFGLVTRLKGFICLSLSFFSE